MGFRYKVVSSSFGAHTPLHAMSMYGIYVTVSPMVVARLASAAAAIESRHDCLQHAHSSAHETVLSPVKHSPDSWATDTERFCNTSNEKNKVKLELNSVCSAVQELPTRNDSNNCKYVQ
eukprot:scpid105897/ scgid12248/ 